MIGLSSSEAEEIRKKSGPNSIKEKKEGLIKKILKVIFSPISLMLVAAAFLSLIIGKVFDFYFIFSLFFLNSFIGIFQEHKADKAIEKLSEKLKISVKVLRDGKWKFIDSSELVQGDIIEMVVGDIVPADIKLLETKNVSINESVLTGESLPKEKKNGDVVYGGSYLSTGWLRAEVTATGKNTFFNKTLLSVEKTRKRSILEQDILSTSRLLMIISLISVFILTTVLLIEKANFLETLIIDLSLLIAGVPVALPVVMSLIISLGVLQLAKKNTIVRRLSSLDDLANVNLLLTDKTGTLTKNEMNIPKIIPYNLKEDQIILFASASAFKNEKDTINHAIIERFNSLKNKEKLKLIDFTPADSERKRSTSLVQFKGKNYLVSVGASQVIEKLCRMDKKLKSRYNKDLEQLSNEGYKTIAIAVKEDSKTEKNMELAGILVFADPLIKDAKGVIDYLEENGIQVKMLTGDNLEISKRISSELGLDGIVVQRNSINWKSLNLSQIQKIVTFSEVLPSDKLALVEKTKQKYVVAVTGDGINDLPAIKNADVGIAVSNAVDALKNSADIVLLSSGISVIKDAIIESRKIFSRLYTYSVYRISESFRLIISILVLGLIAGAFPLTATQLILLAFLNDLPIISLAFNRVKNTSQPAKINVKKRMTLSLLFGSVGLINSLLFYFLLLDVFHVSFPVLETMFFLKFTVSGHLLIYVAHTKERWYKFLPSKSVIFVTMGTQVVATIIGITGILMNPISITSALFVWLWAIFWMQITELMKIFQEKILKQ